MAGLGAHIVILAAGDHVNVARSQTAASVCTGSDFGAGFLLYLTFASFRSDRGDVCTARASVLLAVDCVLRGRRSRIEHEVSNKQSMPASTSRVLNTLKEVNDRD